MRLGPRPRASQYEGLVLVSVVEEDGSTDSYWDTEANVAKKLKPNCGPCCHKGASVLVIGKCVRGKINGKRLRDYVPDLDERR